MCLITNRGYFLRRIWFQVCVCARLLLTAAAATLSCAYLKCASGNGILDIRVSKKSEVSTLSVNYSIKMGDN